jgi:hypothetical protein
VNWIEVEARLPRHVAQGFEVQARRSQLERGRNGSTQAGNPVSEKRKKGQQESSERRRFRSTGPYTGED